MTGLVGPWLGGLRRRGLVVGPWVGGVVVGHLAGIAWLGSLGLVVLGSNARSQPRLQPSSSTTRWLSHGANPRHRHSDSHGPTLRHRHGPNLRHRHVTPHVPPLRPCCCLHPDAARCVLSIVLSSFLRPLLPPEVANSQQSLRLLLCLRVRNRDSAEVVGGTVVDAWEQRPALPGQDRTRGLQRDD